MPRASGTATPAKKTAAKKPAQTPPPPVDDDETAWFATLDDTIDFTNTLLYGREGSYKTTNLATLANAIPADNPTGRILIVNAEGGLKKKPLQNRGIDTSRIVFWPKPGRRVTHRGLDELHRRVKADLERDPLSWYGVGFDSATEIHIAILDHVQEKRVTTIKNKGAEVDEDFVDISDYGTMSKMFRDVLRKFRDLPCHFVVTALERRDIDKDTGKPQYGPAVTPGLQTDLLGYVDFVIMCKAADEAGPGRGLTRANSRYRAKDRFDVLPKILAEPTMERILAYLDGSLVEEDDPAQDALPSTAKTAQDAPAKAEKEEETTDPPEE